MILVGCRVSVKISIGNFPVGIDVNGLVSLNDLWKVSGADRRNRPGEWLKTEVAKWFIATFELGENIRHAVEARRRGLRYPVTFAHWKAAVAYARRLGLEVSVTFNHPAVLKPAAPIFNLPAIRKPVQVQPVGPPPFTSLPSKFLIGNNLVATNGDGLINLTDLWKASGQRHHEKPTLWLQKVETRQFIGAVEEKLGVSKYALLKKVLGRTLAQGTYAHWQIALAYAKYLSPELHMQVNEVFMRYKTGDALTS